MFEETVRSTAETSALKAPPVKITQKLTNKETFSALSNLPHILSSHCIVGGTRSKTENTKVVEEVVE